ncbi:MAG: twin-arginine translocase TatA/TatE family subunit [Desulfomonilaceae bacterium]
MWEIVLILVVALIFLGPRQLTETARVLGKLYREIQKMAFDVRNSIDFDLDLPSPHVDSPKPEKEPDRKATDDNALLPQPGEKTGPDFYAELLESSKEEKSSQTGESEAQIPEKTITKPDQTKESRTADES